MKKIFVLLLMTIMLTAMVACATEKNQESDLQDMVTETEKTETEKVETKAAEIPQETIAPIKEMSFQELTVIDDEYCVIKVTRINYANQGLNFPNEMVNIANATRPKICRSRP